MKEKNKIIIYTDESGSTKLDVRLEDETLWLTQAQLCSLYKTSKSNVSEHIKHIFEEDELQEDSVVRKFRTAAADGKMYLTTFYNLDMIIALGYRVRTIIATRFRQWATQRLKEHINQRVYICYKGVNIFHKHIYHITTLLSAYCETYCLTFQKRRFCTVKAAVLHCKTYAFATSNRNYRF